MVMEPVMAIFEERRIEIMTMKMISYDLRKPEQDYAGLIEAIKNYKNYCKINKSDWIIKTSDSCSEIRDNLNKYLDKDDTLFVCELSGKWASWNLRQATIDWLND